MSGVGKGLAGVVTKPIGGAAEFVAQTGSGLLQGNFMSECDVKLLVFFELRRRIISFAQPGTGLQSQAQQRYVPICNELSLGFSSTLKFQWKIFNGGSGSGPFKTNKTTQPDLSSMSVKSADDSERVVFALEAIKGNSG